MGGPNFYVFRRYRGKTGENRVKAVHGFWHWQNLQYIELVRSLLHHFYGHKTLEKLDLWDTFPIFKIYSSPENDVTRKWKVWTAGLIFHEVFKNEVIFDAASSESPAATNVFSKYLKGTFWKQIFFPAPGTGENNHLSYMRKKSFF